MVQLDSLRALSIFGVMIEHFIPGSVYASFLSSWGGAFPLEWGSGVTLFFVLSGFLITGILLRCRDMVDLTKQSARFTSQRFYIRRFLRIFPVYYLALFSTAIIFNFNNVSNEYSWHLTYTSNIRIFVQQSWDGYASHFWSLAMEEQFYLIWPLVILFLPKQYLLRSILLTVALAPLFRFIGCYGLHLSTIQIAVFPFASLDALGLGALLAFYTHNHEKFNYARSSICKFGLWVCFPLLVLFVTISFAYKGTVLLNLLVRPTILSIFFVWLISGAAKGFSGVPGRLLELKPLVFMGKISYGIYVYHYFISSICDRVFDYFNLTESFPLIFVFSIKFLASLAVAIPSWFFIEKPINSFKRNFGYKQTVV